MTLCSRHNSWHLRAPPGQTVGADDDSMMLAAPDYCRLQAITLKCHRHRLEDVMLQHHNKTAKLLKEQTHRDPCLTHHKKDHQWESVDTPVGGCQWEPIDTPTSGQFDLDDDLEADIYNPLETPTDMPIQDENATPILEDVPAESVQSSVVMPAEDHMLDKVDDNVSVVSSSQEK